VAEISGLGDGGMSIYEFGDAGENQHRGHLRRHDVGLADVEVIELEFIEFA
jgi:hypothetical protein